MTSRTGQAAREFPGWGNGNRAKAISLHATRGCELIHDAALHADVILRFLGEEGESHGQEESSAEGLPRDGERHLHRRGGTQARAPRHIRSETALMFGAASFSSSRLATSRWRQDNAPLGEREFCRNG
ncbi:MAG: hypothetical protein U0V48_05530 [Anaerolineales bacterium]